MALSSSASILSRSAMLAVPAAVQRIGYGHQHQLLGEDHVGSEFLTVAGRGTGADQAGQRLVAGDDPGIAPIHAQPFTELLEQRRRGGSEPAPVVDALQLPVRMLEMR